ALLARADEVVERGDQTEKEPRGHRWAASGQPPGTRTGAPANFMFLIFCSFDRPLAEFCAPTTTARGILGQGPLLATTNAAAEFLKPWRLHAILSRTRGTGKRRESLHRSTFRDAAVVR